MTQSLPLSGKHPLIIGAIGHNFLINFKFVLRAPWSACRLCGAVYQSDLDRLALNLMLDNDPEYLPTYQESTRMREDWRKTHERKFHTQHEIDLLEQSGLAVTPEAAFNLAPYGIIAIGDTASNKNVYYATETDDALFEAPRAPHNDAEGT